MIRKDNHEPILSTKMAGHLILSNHVPASVKEDLKNANHSVFFFPKSDKLYNDMQSYSTVKDDLYRIYNKK